MCIILFSTMSPSQVILSPTNRYHKHFYLFMRTAASFNSRYIKTKPATTQYHHSIQRQPHLFKGHRYKVVQRNGPRGQLRFTVWRNKLAYEIRPHREFYASVRTEYYTCSTCKKHSPSRVKLNRGGKSRPFGILAPSTRNSSKNG